MDVRWGTYLGMLKYFAKHPVERQSQSDIYEKLIEVLEKLIDKEQVQNLLQVNKLLEG